MTNQISKLIAHVVSTIDTDDQQEFGDSENLEKKSEFSNGSFRPKGKKNETLEFADSGEEFSNDGDGQGYNEGFGGGGQIPLEDIQEEPFSQTSYSNRGLGNSEKNYCYNSANEITNNFGLVTNDLPLDGQDFGDFGVNQENYEIEEEEEDLLEDQEDQEESDAGQDEDSDGDRYPDEEELEEEEYNRHSFGYPSMPQHFSNY